MIVLGLFLLPLVAAQGQRCQWTMLRNVADLVREGVSSGELDPSFTLASNCTYLENGKPESIKTGIFTHPLKLDYDSALIDQESCAIATTLVSPSSQTIIEAQIFFDPLPAGSGPSALEATAVDIITQNVNVTQIEQTLNSENWDYLPQEEQATQEAIRTVADGYLVDLLGTRTGDEGRRYVVDTTMGAVSVFLAPGQGAKAQATREGYLFRVEGSKVRYVHHFSGGD
ncbi:hypothetical protein QBC47DRAFT_391856 [Echria macrotheca]|uniref:DUF8021 domain-containing protein n=1 Tax=Echria macrotheca TaxID=438768 RepID=A0AAJ0F7T1_9PEZI|nr:hypothetical protein QBC47DRAFT_391856 [Echria macrotheca]